MKKASSLAQTLSAVSLFAGCGGGEDSEPAARTTEERATTDDAKLAARTPEERVATTEDAPTPAESTRRPSGPYVGSWRARLTVDDIAEAAGNVNLAASSASSFERTART